MEGEERMERGLCKWKSRGEKKKKKEEKEQGKNSLATNKNVLYCRLYCDSDMFALRICGDAVMWILKNVEIPSWATPTL